MKNLVSALVISLVSTVGMASSKAPYLHLNFNKLGSAMEASQDIDFPAVDAWGAPIRLQLADGAICEIEITSVAATSTSTMISLKVPGVGPTISSSGEVSSANAGLMQSFDSYNCSVNSINK